MSKTLAFADLAALLSTLGHAEPAAAFHGNLCGALCRETAESVDPAALLDDEARAPDADGLAALDQLREQSVNSLTDAEHGFALVLPDDEQPLAERAQALADWCDGFLFGLSARVPLEISKLSEEVREVISDFTQFTRAEFGAGDDLESEETAYAELVEYIRVGAQLVYMELHPRPAAAADVENYNKRLH